MEDLARIRRFSLLMGVLLISYVLAGIAIDPGQTLQTYGFSWRILRPELLPAGLALGSLYSIYQYWLHAIALRRSPWRERKEILRALEPSTADENMLETQETSQEEVETLRSRADAVFPRFLDAEASFFPIRTSPRLEGMVNVRPTYRLGATIPRRVRWGTRIQDFDYTLPFWINGLALILYSWFLFRSLRSAPIASVQQGDLVTSVGFLGWLGAYASPLLITAGLCLDIVGAILVASEVVRQYRGRRFETGGRMDDALLKGPKPVHETEEFAKWQVGTYDRMKWGLGLLLIGFVLQILATWIR